MAAFLSCDVYFSIFKRHIDRKLIEINKNCQPKKRIISFDQCQFRGNVSKTDKFTCLGESESVITEKCNKNKEFQLNERIIPSQSSLRERISVFNESPPMDLDESFVSSDSEENSQSSCRQQLFIDWFLSVIIQQDVLENANEMQFSKQLSVIVNEDHLFLSDATNNKQIRFTPHQSWIIVYLFCQSETISIYTFSGKLLIKLIIDACVTDLRLDVVDVYRVLAFLTDHPIIDLQLAYRQIHPDQCCDNLSVMKKRVGNTECTSDKSESQQLGEIHDYLMDKLRIENTMNIYLFISCSTNASLAAMEYFGIEVDMDKWEIFHQCVTSTLQSVENEITRITGSAICLSSPSHLKEIIYNQLRLHECLTEQQWLQMGIDNLIEIKSTNELVLSKLAEFHWLPKLVIKYRQISKTKSIYVDSFALFIDRNKNVIRGTWDQNSCVTGRIYCSRPNLQAFPRHQLCFNDESVSLSVKSIFLSSNDYILVSADYAHIELRLYAHMANDERLIGLFHSTDAAGSEDDLFTNLSCLLGIQSSSLTSNNDARQTTKQVIYACLYGIGSKGLAEILAMSVNQAALMIKLVKDYLPRLEEFSDSCFKQVEQSKYSTTISGRKRYFDIQPNSNFSQKLQLKRQIMSYIIQGSAADICKVTMINCQREIGYQNIDARLILSRHDELVWRVNNIDLIELIDIIYKTMNTSALCYRLASHIESIDLRVPLKVKVKKGPSLTSLEIIEHLTK